MSNKELEDKVQLLEKKVAYLEGQLTGLLMFKANQQQTPYYPGNFPTTSPGDFYKVTCNAS